VSLSTPPAPHCRFLLPLIDPYGGPSWYLACLLPPSAASLLAACLVNWERVAAGINWDTWDLPVAQQSGFCVQSVFSMLALDVLLYGLLTWYCDKVGGGAGAGGLGVGWEWAGAGAGGGAGVEDVMP
jgi:hypothetical protein